MLFVDDEPHIRDGLRRALRGQRHAWAMEFVASGESALEAMVNQPFDVVVSDMRMPGMDGATLLAEVRNRSPRTVRIILSGHSDAEAAMRSVCTSHQFLAKPCLADELRVTVERACNLEVLLHETDIQAVLGNIGSLPVLPRTYHALVVALADPEVDLGRVAAIIEQDQGISAKILQIVNSSFFGVRREITSVLQATSYLGIHTVRDLVLSAEVFQQFEDGARTPGFSLDEEQAHSILSSRIARRLVDSKRVAEHAFLAAMLHDLGTLVLATRLPDKHAECLQVRKAQGAPIHTVERSLLKVSHAEIGAYLLGLWGMPYSIVEAVAYHHHPGEVPEQKGWEMLTAVHIAQALAHEVKGHGECLVDHAYLARLGLSDRLPEWRRIAEEEASRGAVE